MSKKTVRKNFRFTEQTAMNLELMVQLEKEQMMYKYNLCEDELHFINQSFIIEKLINARYNELMAMSSDDVPDLF